MEIYSVPPGIVLNTGRQTTTEYLMDTLESSNILDREEGFWKGQSVNAQTRTKKLRGVGLLIILNNLLIT